MVPPPLGTGADYIESLRGRNLRVFYMGERISEPVGHVTSRPSESNRSIAATLRAMQTPASVRVARRDGWADKRPSQR